MRINKFVALASGLSRRAADREIESGKVYINDSVAKVGDTAEPNDVIMLNGRKLILPITTSTILLNKPIGYVCSRNGQGSLTIYDLLPNKYHNLKPIGRLDKDSSGLILLSNDGMLANQLTHPSFRKLKKYLIKLDRDLSNEDMDRVIKGVSLEDGISSLNLKAQSDRRNWLVSMHEGRNRQIRRTFATLHYQTIELKRISFGDYQLNDLQEGKYLELN